MRRKFVIAHLCMIVIIALVSICHAANDAPTYDAAIEKLASYRERTEVENALEGFSDIKSDYGNVSLLRMYAEAIWSGIIIVQSQNSPRCDRIRTTGR